MNRGGEILQRGTYILHYVTDLTVKPGFLGRYTATFRIFISKIFVVTHLSFYLTIYVHLC